VLDDGIHGIYPLNPPSDNPELQLPARSRVGAQLVFIGPLNPAARRLTLSTNDGVGTTDNPFDDAPVLRVELPVAAAGETSGRQANHPDGAALRVRNVAANPTGFVVSLTATNGNEREIRLNQHDSLVLTDPHGAAAPAQPPADNRQLAVPPGARLDAELIFPRTGAGQAARLILSANDGAGGTADNPYDTTPVFKLALTVDGGQSGVAGASRATVVPIARSRLSAPAPLGALAAAVGGGAPPSPAAGRPTPSTTGTGVIVSVAGPNLAGLTAPGRIAPMPAAPTPAAPAPAVPTAAVPTVQPAAINVPLPRPVLRIEESDRGRRILLPADALFGAVSGASAGAPSEKLESSADPVLQDAARLIAGSHAREVIVVGHTDGVGRDDDNQARSERRARAVAEWLRTHAGKPGPRFVEMGFGRTRPIAPNHNPDGSDNSEGRQQNRRIELYLRG